MTSVLIIDDHPIVLQGCRRMLEDAGIQRVLEARDATSGYRLYRRHHPDVVIVDLAMQGSGLSGLDVIRRMRSHDPRTRILVFSMHSDPIIAARALDRRHRLRAQGHVFGRADEGVRPGALWDALSQQRSRHAGGLGAHRRAARAKALHPHPGPLTADGCGTSEALQPAPQRSDAPLPADRRDARVRLTLMHMQLRNHPCLTKLAMHTHGVAKQEVARTTVENGRREPAHVAVNRLMLACGAVFEFLQNRDRISPNAGGEGPWSSCL